MVSYLHAGSDGKSHHNSDVKAPLTGAAGCESDQISDRRCLSWEKVVMDFNLVPFVNKPCWV